MRFFFRHPFRSFFVFVGAVPERSAIPAEMPDVKDLSDHARFDEFIGFAMGSDPLQRPVDHERFVAWHRPGHGVRLFQGSREGLFHQEMNVKGSHLLYPFAMPGGGRTKYDHVGLGLLEARAMIGKTAFGRDAQFPHNLPHACRLFIGNAHNFDLRMLVRIAEQIAHVKVIKVDARNSPGFALHAFMLTKGQAHGNPGSFSFDLSLVSRGAANVEKISAADYSPLMNSFPVATSKEDQLAQRMAAVGLREADLSETFVRSGGHGGQNVNKTATCVMLVHRPTGLQVKCQTTRQQGMNRFLARKLLLEKLEERQRERLATQLAQKVKTRRQKRGRSAAAKRRMLADKSHHAARKELRRPVTD